MAASCNWQWQLWVPPSSAKMEMHLHLVNVRDTYKVCKCIRKICSQVKVSTVRVIIILYFNL